MSHADPNVQLRRIRELVDKVENATWYGTDLPDHVSDALIEIAQLTTLLDRHLSFGGELPDEWYYARHR